MKVLTVRQPWAGLIARGIKDVENRTWAPSIGVGTRFAIHTGRWDDILPTGVDIDHPLCHAHQLVICTVRLVDVTRDSTSPWAIPDCWHWVLDTPRLVRNSPRMRGWRGLWEPPE